VLRLESPLLLATGDEVIEQGAICCIAYVAYWQIVLQKSKIAQ
jgi:hypothetical protein